MSNVNVIFVTKDLKALYQRTSTLEISKRNKGVKSVNIVTNNFKAL